MTDKELLELAAKAAGITEPWSTNTLAAFQYDAKHWNPLTDDGDCARLEAKLKINVLWDVYGESGSQSRDAVNAGGVVEPYYKHDGDKDKARRYASTRAAAEIGKQKE
jgi:hypothetical protein